mmetsp:Transcript_40940/g.80796  ORF Transcript_40940/g.80796 Transcript_40940/m.80796 type:complete len:694 (+) Transcript_40940:98-2179(+)|eukprot:CAMPEP_0172824458 /NCGR_PEP_ID=MMETSP1075-20121228/18021_1 /TAXON_ID=2916 /ORGANISM="Ceratium fusus, Strain PA161109" /LENGTH=693 /DNA_ID=CAMNT_0013665741 /DNA_START=28 /DNA_END=2109 /DNA_ORIENTATION=+
MAYFGAILALALPALALAITDAERPITRVVNLLKNLDQKLEADFKAEQTVFENYQCWYKSVVAGKTASNSDAKSRVDSLETYIKDIEAGRIEFTTEREDLTKQIAGLEKDLETATALRKEENKDYLAAKEEMEQALDALDAAIATMEKGTKKSRLFSLRHNIKKVMELGREFLSDADAQLLEHQMSRDEPKDWKKLNRKATFKMKYNSRSGDIVKLLKKLQTTFKDNLAAADKAETSAVADYEKLKKSKEEMLGSAKEALEAMVKENGARGLSKTEAEEEVKALKTQVEADEEFIEQVEKAYKEKKGQWEDRKTLRQEERVSISKAIAVLHSDDARDTFKKSFESQGHTFLQLHSQNRPLQVPAAATISALAQLRALAGKSLDPRLVLLTQRAGETDSVAKVVEMVEKLIATLEQQAEEDLKKKEECESERARLTREAKVTSQEIDDLTDEITRAKEKVKEIISQIAEQDEIITNAKGSIKEITRQREYENEDYKREKVDDLRAVELVGEALTILKKMQKKFAGEALLNVHRHGQHVKQPVEVKAGEAPPPPPATWDAPYGGAEGETTGIVSLLELIETDIKKDIKEADKEEEDAAAAFKVEKAELEKTIQAAKDANNEYTKAKSEAEKEAVAKGTIRGTKKGELDSTMKEIDALAPGCDFLLMNFEIRLQKRTLEIDGLKKAKLILKSAKLQ